MAGSPSVATLRRSRTAKRPRQLFIVGEEDDYALLKSSVVIPARQRMKKVNGTLY